MRFIDLGSEGVARVVFLPKQPDEGNMTGNRL